MHFVLQKPYEDIDRLTFHHLVHDQYYNKQLDEFLSDQDRKNETVCNLFSNIIEFMDDLKYI